MKPKSKLLGKRDGFVQKAAMKFSIFQEHISLTQTTLLNFSPEIPWTRYKVSAFGRNTESSQYNTLKQPSNLLPNHRWLT